jgi:hypothetical protein
MKIIVNISSQFNKEHLLSRVYLPGDNRILFGFDAFYLCVMFHQISDQIVMHARVLVKIWSICQGFPPPLRSNWSTKFNAQIAENGISRF